MLDGFGEVANSEDQNSKKSEVTLNHWKLLSTCGFLQTQTSDRNKKCENLQQLTSDAVRWWEEKYAQQQLLHSRLAKRKREDHIIAATIWVPLSSHHNQIFYYIRCITPKRVMSLLRSSPHYWSWATQLHQRTVAAVASRCNSCPIWPAQNLNIRPPAPKTNELSRDQ